MNASPSLTVQSSFSLIIVRTCGKLTSDFTLGSGAYGKSSAEEQARYRELKPPVVHPVAAPAQSAKSLATTSPLDGAKAAASAITPSHDASNSPQTAETAASPQVQANGHAIVTISDGKKLIVPTLVGLPMRKVIETASNAGLNIEIVGSGTARAQAPAPGTKVPTGTKIVVHCSY